MYAALRRALFTVPRTHPSITLVFAALRGRDRHRTARRQCAGRWLLHDLVLASTVFGVSFQAARTGCRLRQGRPGPDTPGARWDSATPRSAPSPRRRSRATRSRGCSGCPTGAAQPDGVQQPRRRPVGAATGWPPPARRADRGEHRQVEGHPPERAVDDYRSSARLLGPLAATWWSTSAPQHPGPARPAGRRVAAADPDRGAGRDVDPVLVKIAPDLSDEDVDAVADLAVELGLAGIVATNTTISRAGLRTPASTRSGPGGSQGHRWPIGPGGAAPAARRVGDRLVLISVGGIETAEDAWQRITAGASLLQGYTGFVYGGACGPRAFTTGSPHGCTPAGSRHWPRRSAPRRLNLPARAGAKSPSAGRHRAILRLLGDEGGLLLFVGPVDGGPGDRVHEQVEAEVGRAGVLGEFELLDTACTATSSRCTPCPAGGRADEPHAGVIAQRQRVARQPSRRRPRTAGR